MTHAECKARDLLITRESLALMREGLTNIEIARRMSEKYNLNYINLASKQIKKARDIYNEGIEEYRDNLRNNLTDEYMQLIRACKTDNDRKALLQALKQLSELYSLNKQVIESKEEIIITF